MSDIEEKNIQPSPRITFEIDPKRHPLQKTLRKLDKNVDEAINVVLEVIANTELDPKTRLQAAQYLIDTKLKINSEISKEVLSRQIAEVKMLQAQQPKQMKTVVPEEDDEEEGTIASFQPNVILKVDTNTL